MNKKLDISPGEVMPRPIVKRFKEAALALFKHPVIAPLKHSAFIFNVGNNFIALNESSSSQQIENYSKALSHPAYHSLFQNGLGSVGVIASLAATTVIGGTILYETLTNKPRGLPFKVLAGTNVTTGAAIVSLAIYDALKMNDLNVSNHHLIGTAVSAACLTIWGAAHVCRARLASRSDHDPRNFGESPQLYTGVADAVASQKASPTGTLVSDIGRSFSSPQSGAFGALALDLTLMAPFVCGLVKSYFELKTAQKKKMRVQSGEDNFQNSEILTFSQFFQKHTTSNRIYAAGYVLSTTLALASHQPAYVVTALGLWAAGFIPFDKEQNASFRQDLKHVMQAKLVSKLG